MDRKRLLFAIDHVNDFVSDNEEGAYSFKLILDELWRLKKLEPEPSTPDTRILEDHEMRSARSWLTADYWSLKQVAEHFEITTANLVRQLNNRGNEK